MEEDYADELAKALQLPRIASVRLIKAIKSWKASQAVAPAAAQAPEAGTLAVEQLSEAMAQVAVAPAFFVLKSIIEEKYSRQQRKGLQPFLYWREYFSSRWPDGLIFDLQDRSIYLVEL